MDWVDFDLDPVLLGQKEIWQNWLGSWVRLWNFEISQLNPGSRPLDSPCNMYMGGIAIYNLSELPGPARPCPVGVYGVLDGGLDPGVGRHAQVVVAAPHVDRDVAPGELARRREGLGRAVHLLEDAVRVVQLLLPDLLLEERLVREPR